MPEPAVLICMPVDHPGYVVPGSLHESCHKCGRGVWISPSSWFLLHDNPGAEVLCTDCALDRMGKEPGRIMEFTPAQVHEIEEYRRGKDSV